MKRSVSLICSFFALLVILFCFGISASAKQTADIPVTRIGTSQTFYSFDAGTKTLRLSGKGAVPNFTNSSGLSSSQPWFEWRSDGSVEHIVVEEGITSLGNFCFYYVEAKDIVLPSTLKNIGVSTFGGIQYISDFVIPDGVTKISNNAFANSYGLERIYIPKSVTLIGEGAFSNCRNLCSVQFGHMNMNVKISDSAFVKCPALKSFYAPKGAQFSPHSFGFFEDSDGAVYEDVMMYVYRDSQAYTYAVNSFVKYSLMNEMEIFDGDTISCTYYSDTVGNAMIFSFTPQKDAYYSFYSSGKVDVDCVIKDSHGTVVAECEDISDDDRNFSISTSLIQDETYQLIVTSANSLGTFSVTLMPNDIADININWNITLQAEYLAENAFSVDDYLSGCTINFVYASGYVHRILFADGESYAGYDIKYVKKIEEPLRCGDNVGTVSVGGRKFNFNITVEHNFEKKVVEPTLRSGGYTEFTCVYCKYRYLTDYTDCLGSYIYGRVVAMESLTGEHPHNKIIDCASVYDANGVYLTEVNENGEFSLEYAYDKIYIDSTRGPRREVKVERENHNLGDIAVIYCDYNNDNYISAKDFIFVRKNYGRYDPQDDYLASLDINSDGLIDDTDWAYCVPFLACGRLTENIYKN